MAPLKPRSSTIGRYRPTLDALSESATVVLLVLLGFFFLIAL